MWFHGIPFKKTIIIFLPFTQLAELIYFKGSGRIKSENCASDQNQYPENNKVSIAFFQNPHFKVAGPGVVRPASKKRTNLNYQIASITAMYVFFYMKLRPTHWNNLSFKFRCGRRLLPCGLYENPDKSGGIFNLCCGQT
jgi:hypothetical protein